MKILPKRLRAFTLIELLVVIGVLTVLLAIVLIAINPARQFSQANNTQRRSDVNALLNAVHQYAADNKGDIASLGIPEAPVIAAEVGSADVDLCQIDQVATPGNVLLVPIYIADIPLDPQDGTTDATGSQTCSDLTASPAQTYASGYFIQQNSARRITVTAPGVELGESISVTR